MLRLIGRLLRFVLILVATAVAIPLIGLAWGFATTEAPREYRIAAADALEEAIATKLRAEIPGYQRPQEATWLTYPEWAIVYAARDYAATVAERPPHAFAYWASISRFWQDYATMIRAASGHPFNGGAHLMLTVIGVSHTIEHAVQSIWENTVGRLTGIWFPTREDHYQAKVAADYAGFLDQTPWYRFNYAGARSGLWAAGPDEGAAAIRSWERLLAFGLSYTIKQTYAGAIQSGLQATHDPAALEIFVWAQGPVAAAIAGEPATRIVRDLGPDGAVFVTGRYQSFTELVPRLIARGVRLVEIGGNRSIMATVLSEGRLTPFEDTRRLFSDALPSDPTTVRTGLDIPVAALHEALPSLEAAGARLEHLYDY